MIKKLRRRSLNLIYILYLLILLNESVFGQEKNWTHFRGSNLNGIAYTDSIPLKWDSNSIKWKTVIHGRGYSSPVVYDNQVWVTSSTGDGKELYAVCVDFISGKIIYDIRVFSPENIPVKHSINTYASPSPCIEMGFVYVNYGSLGTACIRTSDGRIVWARSDLKCNHAMGAGSSPVLYKNLLILHFEGTDVRFIVALDKATGKTKWLTSRPETPYVPLSEIARKSYTTPYILNVKGLDQLISNGSAVCSAYDPLTGVELWRVTRGAESTVAMPFAEKGIIYFYTGFMVDPVKNVYTELIAVNPVGRGDITVPNMIWKKKDGQVLNQILTPVIKDGLIYTVTSKNILMCIDAKSGEEIWSVRMRANYNASPVYLNGEVWFFSIRGDVIALKSGRRYDLIAQNRMDSGIWATPAFLRNSVILRTEKYLCMIGF